VYDEFGNPVQNVPVTFSLRVAAGTALEETLDSGGAPRFTDSSGRAFDTLRTRAALGGVQKAVTVAASLPVGVGSTDEAAPSVTVYIN
jgi:hypothetical protein